MQTLLERRGLLLVAPTGGGKSLVYQLPALILGGTTLVVSPLIALMTDQVLSLLARGVRATFIASTLSADEQRHRLEQMRAGAYQLVYASPERCSSPEFLAAFDAVGCPLIAIDEAHCISAWGHDFRPEYLQLGRLLGRRPSARVLACTATASPRVREEIRHRLGLGPAVPERVESFEHPNLHLSAVWVRSAARARHVADHRLAQVLDADSSAGAIVYAGVRRRCELEADRLRRRGLRAVAYHAGIEPDQRQAIQRAFLDGGVSVVVATGAFGMGIDRQDVRVVIHLTPPASLDAYYQEVGRAGRDGRTAWGLLLHSPADLMLRRRLVVESSPDGLAQGAHHWEQFLELMRWTHTRRCRYGALLRHFDPATRRGPCQRCDVCLAADRRLELTPAEEHRLVRKALSGVARVRGRFGLAAVAKLLCGQADRGLEQAALTRSSTFGVLSHCSDSEVLELLCRCVASGWVTFPRVDRPVVTLTEPGRRALLQEAPWPETPSVPAASRSATLR